MLKTRKPASWITYILSRVMLLIYSLTILYPIFWVVSMSLKPNDQIFQDIWGLPQTWAFDNYVRAWEASQVGRFFMNSVIITTITILAILITCIPLSYTLGRFKFRGRGIIKAIIISGLLLPSMTGLVSQYIMLLYVGLADTYTGLTLIYLAVSIPFTVFMLSNFFAAIPVEFEEAAKLEGCGYWRTLWFIMTPMARNGILMVTVLNVLSVWNEYTIALTVISTQARRTIAIGVAAILRPQMNYTDWGALFAAMVILMTMSFLIYALFQRKIMENVTLGGIKG